MPVPAALVAATVAAPVVGGLMGNIMSAGDRSQARKAMKQAYEELKKVGLPPDLSSAIIFEEFTKAGILTPELEEDLQLARSEFEQIKEDPTLRNTQLEALNRFKQQSQGGLAGDERAALNDIQRELARDAEAKRHQILMDSQRRGMGGSGNELIAQLQGAQAADEAAATQGNELMKLIAQRVRTGAQDSANLSGQMRDQDYQRQSDRARALDARNQFQYTNSMARNARNTDRTNRVNEMNLSEAQRLRDANVNQRNQELLRQRNEKGAHWDRKLSYGQSMANARLGQAGQYNAQADRTAGMYSGIGQGVGQGLSAFAKYQADSNPGNGYGGDESVSEEDDFYMSEGWKYR
jgi:hypothetical protein